MYRIPVFMVIANCLDLGKREVVRGKASNESELVASSEFLVARARMMS
jgi:hypothetical protein